MPDLVTGEGNNEDDDNESERASQSSIPLSISVYKKGGPYLEFNCVGYPDEIIIDSLSVKNPDLTEDQIAYEGPDFQYVLLSATLWKNYFLFFIVVRSCMIELVVFYCLPQGLGWESAEVFPQVFRNQRNQTQHNQFLAWVYDQQGQ